jgi:cell wall-associated NlpC family hydrolase
MPVIDINKLPTPVRRKLADKFVQYAWSFVGTPYQWGGDDPIGGVDCSGYVILCLQAVGLFPVGQDTTADGLYRRFHTDICTWRRPPRGSLLFWLKQEKAYHVAIYDEVECFLEAGGGSRAVTDRNAADKYAAFVRLNHLSQRPHWIACDIFKLRLQ